MAQPKTKEPGVFGTVTEDHLALMLALVPDARSPADYGPGFGEDVSFSPVITDKSSTMAVAKVLVEHGDNVVAIYFGQMSGFRGSYQVHVVFKPGTAAAACRMYESIPQ